MLIYDQSVDAFSEPRAEPPIRRAQINRPSKAVFLCPRFPAVIRPLFERGTGVTAGSVPARANRYQRSAGQPGTDA